MHLPVFCYGVRVDCAEVISCLCCGEIRALSKQSQGLKLVDDFHFDFVVLPLDRIANADWAWRLIV